MKKKEQKSDELKKLEVEKIALEKQMQNMVPCYTKTAVSHSPRPSK